MPYFQWLVSNYPPSEHHCDLVAYFFRRAHAQLGNQRTFGLIATNTIAQGDTREGGLREILRRSGHIYAATKRLRWPGQAAVVVSVVHITKGEQVKFCSSLDGKSVSRISAYLLDSLIDDSPARLITNPYFSIGSKIYGQGFLFADNDPECSSLSVREELLRNHPAWENEYIFSYIGNE